jgi:hypothetical protein
MMMQETQEMLRTGDGVGNDDMGRFPASFGFGCHAQQRLQTLIG